MDILVNQVYFKFLHTRTHLLPQMYGYFNFLKDDRVATFSIYMYQILYLHF